MLRRVRVTQALVIGPTLAVALAFGTGCSVDRTGLSEANGASVATGGSSVEGGRGGATGTGGLDGAAAGSGGASSSDQTGGTSGGTGGMGSLAGGGGNAVGGAGGLGRPATGGTAGRAAPGAGGALGSGGLSGDGGGGGLGDASGSGGASGTGGATAAGGAGGLVSGTGGEAGAGGAAATGGKDGSGGVGGGHPPDCRSFPLGASFTTPTDGLLHCYWVHNAATDWATAESTCVSESGTLATILSPEENAFVLDTLTQAKAIAPLMVAWLGANDGKQSNDKTGPGTYAWVTGEPWDFENWHSYQPDGSCTCQPLNGCSCQHWLAILGDGTWYSRPETLQRPSICEAIAR